MQEHLHDKTQPENIAFLQNLRRVMDEFDDRATVGEVGDGARSLETVAAYTEGGDKLNMCYTFDLLGPDFTPEHIRRSVEGFHDAVTDGWVCWAFSNHDVERHVSRFIDSEEERESVAKLACTLISTLKGSVCLYQGEELGLPEAQLAFEDLRDPYGIRFWPAFKGRDGCRTPMVWEVGRDHAGFTTAEKPWLPVLYEQAVLAVNEQESDPHSVLHHYRRTLAFRKAHPVLRDGDMSFLEAPEGGLAFTRKSAAETLLFVFNLGRSEVSFVAPADLGRIVAEPLPGYEGGSANGRIDLDPFSAFCARVQ